MILKVLLMKDHAVISDKGGASMVASANMIAHRMPGESVAYFSARILKDELHVEERVSGETW